MELLTLALAASLTVLSSWTIDPPILDPAVGIEGQVSINGQPPISVTAPTCRPEGCWWVLSPQALQQISQPGQYILRLQVRSAGSAAWSTWSQPQSVAPRFCVYAKVQTPSVIEYRPVGSPFQGTIALTGPAENWTATRRQQFLDWGWSLDYEVLTPTGLFFLAHCRGIGQTAPFTPH